jgi:hypothetical protein
MKRISLRRLEVRINKTGRTAPCTMCERPAERMEVYLAGTEEYICPCCVQKIDQELGLFAYPPAIKYPPPIWPDDDIFGFGVCPICGRIGGWLNVGGEFWAVCKRHGLKWGLGYNLFSNWLDETTEEMWQNHQVLMRLRETEPYIRPTNQWSLIKWLRSSSRSLAAAMVRRIFLKLPADFRPEISPEDFRVSRSDDPSIFGGDKIDTRGITDEDVPF